MSTKAKWVDGTLTYYDPERSYETVGKLSPVQFYEDFLHAWATVPAGGSAESGCLWADKVVLTLGTPDVTGATDVGSGAMQCALDATDEEQEAICYMDDQR